MMIFRHLDAYADTCADSCRARDYWARRLDT